MIHLICYWRFGTLRLTSIWKKNQKTFKNRIFWWDFFSILMMFCSLFSFGSILAHQTSSGMFSEWCHFIWHPWEPWGASIVERKDFQAKRPLWKCVMLFLISKRFNSKSLKEGGVEFPVALFLSQYKLHIHYSQSYTCQLKGVDIFLRVRL